MLSNITGAMTKDDFIVFCNRYIQNNRSYEEFIMDIERIVHNNKMLLDQYMFLENKKKLARDTYQSNVEYFDEFSFNDNIKSYGVSFLNNACNKYVSENVEQDVFLNYVANARNFNTRIKELASELDELIVNQNNSSVIRTIILKKNNYVLTNNFIEECTNDIKWLKERIIEFEEASKIVEGTIGNINNFNIFCKEFKRIDDLDELYLEFLSDKNNDVLSMCNRIENYISLSNYVNNFFHKKCDVPYVESSEDFIKFWRDVQNNVGYKDFNEELLSKRNDDILLFDQYMNMSNEIDEYCEKIKRKYNDLSMSVSANKILSKYFQAKVLEIDNEYKRLRESYTTRTAEFSRLISEFMLLNENLSKLCYNYNDLLTPIKNTVAMLDIEDDEDEEDILNYYVYSITKSVERRMNIYGSSKGISDKEVEELISLIDEKLYVLTNDQRKAIYESVELLNQENTASCLVQGDVSSGKTIVTAALMFLMAKKGMKSVYIVPRRILRTQHLKTLQNYNKILGLGLKIVDADNVKSFIDADIVMNGYSFTGIKFKEVEFDLGVIDEIQLFGVDQRNQIQKTYPNIDMFYTTATPHPRTKLISLIGNMDIVEIREMPPGRKPKNTSAFTSLTDYHINIINEEISKDQVVLVVCPLVNVEGITPFESQQTAYLKYKELFPDFRVELLLSKYGEDKKEEIIEDTVSGEIDILVASKSIEVGVDIPNASVMIIHYPFKNSIKWGVSQLHQLRGRVGRSSQDAYCFIETPDSVNEKSAIGSVLKSEDVFELTKNDFNWRGFEKIIGTKQSGSSNSKKNQEKRIEAYKTIAKHTPKLVAQLERDFVESLEKELHNTRIENLN